MSRPFRVLVVSYVFPPFGEVGSIRIAQFCRYLPDYGIEPIVLSVKDKFYDPCDYTMCVPANVRVVRTTMIPNPLDFYGKLTRRFKSQVPSAVPISTKSAETNSRSSLRSHILALLQIPDRHWGWYLPAMRMAEELLRNERVDVIFSSGPSWISHVIARRLKEKFGMPWLADFRDPWASLVPQNGPSWWHDLTGRMEASCMRLSDVVICNTERLGRAFQRQYAELDPTKFRTLSNGYGYLPVPPTEKPRTKRLLLHLGSIYGLRRIDTFLGALSYLVDSGRLSAESFQVVLQGDNSPSIVAEAAGIVPDLLRSKCIEFRPRVTWAEARNLLWQADLLLLFQGDNELQVPAKFYEYLETGIPVFAVTEEGALTDVLQSTKSGIWARSTSWREIAEKLPEALRLPRRTPEYVRNSFSEYHYSELTKQLSLWIKDVAVDHSKHHGPLPYSHS